MSELDDLLDPGLENNDNLNYDGRTEPVPNATAVLVLGICSIVGCVALGIAGLVCGIIALVLFKKSKAVYLTNPVKYESSFKNAKAGQICAIIGTSISGLYFIWWIIYFVIIGTLISNLPVT